MKLWKAMHLNMRKKYEGSPFGISVESSPPDRHILQLNHKMRKTFWVHFCDCFACCPDLPVQEFCSYLADFPRLQEAEVASCEGLVTECKVRDALKKVSLNKSPGLDGWPYKVFFRLLHVCAYSNEYVQPLVCPGAIPGSVTKGMITLLKKGGRHVWEDLDDYRAHNKFWPESWQTVCSLSLAIWSDLSRTTLWREGQFKTTCTWCMRS